MAERTPREQETREKTSRKKTWQRPTALPDPEPRPGFVHRWVRTALLGTKDVRNVASKLREGWEFCRIEEYPEFSDFVSESSENIEVGGLILCRCDEDIMRQRDEYYANVAKGQIDSVDNNFMRENDSRMPLLRPERRTTVSSFGRGSKNS